MDNKTTIMESIANGQRKQAWQQMVEFKIGLKDIAQETGLHETIVMLEIGINNEFIILKGSNE